VERIKLKTSPHRSLTLINTFKKKKKHPHGGSTDADLRARLDAAARGVWPDIAGAQVENATFYRVPATGEAPYLAGPDSLRAAATTAAMARPGLAMAVRGGYGTARLLDLIDWRSLQQRSRVATVMGYSDLTALLLAVYTILGRQALHGPMGLSSWSAGSTNEIYARAFLPAGSDGRTEAVLLQNDPAFGAAVTVRGGTGKGRLIGGNLSVFVSLVGSKYLPTRLAGNILFLEDVDEAPYRIDRMLETLRLAGLLDDLAGFVWGTCDNCNRATDTWTVENVIDTAFVNATYPVFRNGQFGHISQQYTVPIGALAELDADKGTINVLP
jgi:muramoyltetrapeptide carboxypeptidase